MKCSMCYKRESTLPKVGVGMEADSSASPYWLNFNTSQYQFNAELFLLPILIQLFKNY